jgi:hypothetical protein
VLCFPVPPAVVGSDPVSGSVLAGYNLPPYRDVIVIGDTSVLNDNPANPAAGQPVVPGDFVDIDGEGVFQVLGFPGGGGLPPVTWAAPPFNTYGRTFLISRPPSMPPIVDKQFRVTGKRLLPSQKPQHLPQGVVVDLTLPWNATNPQSGGAYSFNLTANDRDLTNAFWMRGLSTPLGNNVTDKFRNPDAAIQVDILFGPSGKIVEGAAANDMIYLWLHPDGEPRNWKMRSPGASFSEASNQSFVVINSKTGVVGSFPVDQRFPGGPFTPADPNPDPYSFAKKARAESPGGL